MGHHWSGGGQGPQRFRRQLCSALYHFHGSSRTGFQVDAHIYFLCKILFLIH